MQSMALILSVLMYMSYSNVTGLLQPLVEILSWASTCLVNYWKLWRCVYICYSIHLYILIVYAVTDVSLHLVLILTVKEASILVYVVQCFQLWRRPYISFSIHSYDEVYYISCLLYAVMELSLYLV
jgi:hypothetical protein